MGRKLKKFGVKDLFEVRENLEEAIKKQKELTAILESGFRATPTILPLAAATVFDIFKIENVPVEDMQILGLELTDLNRKIKEMQDLLAGVKEEAFGLINFGEVIAGKTFTQNLVNANAHLEKLNILEREGAINFRQLAAEQDKVVAALEAMGATATEIRSLGGALADAFA